MCKATKMQSLLTGRVPVSSMTGPIKRGLLWQQRDRIFSRWKERYFILTRDYLHCFKRASGSSNGRASDMGQFIFKVKLVDVDKVEWLNRRSYNAIALILGREGRILLRYDDGLEDWFELLEECTQTSKERRKELKIAQGPRSRASLAAPVSHASLHSNHFALGGTSSSTVDDWLMTSRYALSGLRGQKIVTSSVCSYGEPNPFLFSDSVPDLSVLNNENHNHRSGVSTNHSTPQKIPYSASNKSKRCSDSYTSHKDSISNYNGLFNSPQRTLMNSCSDSTHIVDEETEYNEVELRRPRIFRHLSMENGNVMDRDWLYRKPKAPTDMRHSVQPMLPTHNNTFLNKLISDLDCSTHDSGLDTTSSTHRPSSYREQSRNKIYAELTHGDSAENSTSPFRETTLKSTGGSFRCKQISKNYGQHINQSIALHGSRYCVEESAKKTRNKDDFITLTKMYDQHQNRYNKNDCQFIVENGNGNDNTNYNNNNPNANNGSVAFLERHQNPTLAAIINESQSIKFRDRSFSDCQQDSPRRNVNNNPSPSTRKKRNHINAIFGTPTKV